MSKMPAELKCLISSTRGGNIGAVRYSGESTKRHLITQKLVVCTNDPICLTNLNNRFVHVIAQGLHIWHIHTESLLISMKSWVYTCVHAHACVECVYLNLLCVVSQVTHCFYQETSSSNHHDVIYMHYSTCIPSRMSTHPKYAQKWPQFVPVLMHHRHHLTPG